MCLASLLNCFVQKNGGEGEKGGKRGGTTKVIAIGVKGVRVGWKGVCGKKTKNRKPQKRNIGKEYWLKGGKKKGFFLFFCLKYTKRGKKGYYNLCTEIVERRMYVHFHLFFILMVRFCCVCICVYIIYI